jgi:uncharacterized DUF497 family protein
MQIRFYFDEERNQPHIQNHGVSENEAKEVLLQPGEDRPANNGARMAIGKTLSGRLLRVIYVPDSEDNSIFVITAYSLTPKQSKAYRRRRRKSK